MARFKRLKRILLPLDRFVIEKVARVTGSDEFRALYPVLVVALGVLAAIQASGLRLIVLGIAGLLILASSMFIIFQDAQRIRLEYRWNFLLFSYYRPFLINLVKKVARNADRQEVIDTLTYRTDDFVVALDEAAADFAQVSGGERAVNIASFDIEYVPILRDGLTRGVDTYKLKPLAEFWAGRELDVLRQSIVSDVAPFLLPLIDNAELIALPVGWGLVGVAIIEREQFPTDDVVRAIARPHDSVYAFDFQLFFENLHKLEELGYDVFLYDFWTSIVQLLVLNYTGHTAISAQEEQQVETALRELRSVLRPAHIVSDPVVLLDRVRTSSKCIVIGGSTWFGLTGRLLPIAVPNAPPVYSGFCECLGLLATPNLRYGVAWEHDAYELMKWFADQVRGDGLVRIVPPGREAIIQNYLPALLPKNHPQNGGTRSTLLKDLKMRVYDGLDVMFRRFPGNDHTAVLRMKALWEKSRTAPPAPAAEGA
jgi:hypothetical protein